MSNNRFLLNKQGNVTDPWEDHNLEVLQGNVTGHTMVSINGHNDDQTTTRITIAPTITTTEIDQSGLHATAITVDVASTSTDDDSGGTGLLTLTLEGLDSNGNAQTETITLDGQSEVTSANTYSAINGFMGLTSGSGNESAGEIWVGNGSFTSGVPATKYFVGERGHNKGLCAYYTVPTGHTLFLRHVTFIVVGTNKEVELTIESSVDSTGDMWIVENEYSSVSGTVVSIPVSTVAGITAGRHIRMRGEAAGASSELTTEMICELVAD